MVKFLCFMAGVMFMSFLGDYFRWGYDPTDDMRKGQLTGRRSGLTLYTDHQTGMQYVKGGIFGGTTPRLDISGKPISIKGK